MINIGHSDKQNIQIIKELQKHEQENPVNQMTLYLTIPFYWVGATAI